MSRAARWAAAEANVGRRCYWRTATTGAVEGRGTITGVTTAEGGWPAYTVAWDSGSPEWWGTEVSAAQSRAFVVEDGDA